MSGESGIVFCFVLECFHVLSQSEEPTSSRQTASIAKQKGRGSRPGGSRIERDRHPIASFGEARTNQTNKNSVTKSAKPNKRKQETRDTVTNQTRPPCDTTYGPRLLRRSNNTGSPRARPPANLRYTQIFALLSAIISVPSTYVFHAIILSLGSTFQAANSKNARRGISRKLAIFPQNRSYSPHTEYLRKKRRPA